MQFVDQGLCWILLTLRFYAFVFVFHSIRGMLRQIGLLSVASTLALTCVAGLDIEAGFAQRLFDSGLLLFAATVFREVLIGALLAVPLFIALQCFPMAGRLADVARGAQAGEQLNPALGTSQSPLEGLATMFVLLTLFPVGAYYFGVLLLAESVWHPLLGPAAGGLEGLKSFGMGVRELVTVAGAAISSGVALAAPVIIVSAVLDLATAVLSRTLGRVNASFEFLPLKLLLGLAVLALLVQSSSWQAPRSVELGLALVNAQIGAAQ